jgi:glycogen debranching enzyme
MLLQQNIDASQPQPVNAWYLRVGDPQGQSSIDLETSLNREWLVTNGLGGYAAGSLSGATTRSYHGLLVAALRPPVERTVMVTKIDEEVTLPAPQADEQPQVFKLGVNEYQDGTIDPHGSTYLVSVSLEGDIPCFHYRLTPTLTLEKRVWMEYGQNTTYVQYVLRGTLENDTAETSVKLTLYPFCLSRDYHQTTKGAEDWRFLVEPQDNRCRIRAFDGAPTYYCIAGPGALFTPTNLWYWRVLHRRDTERGLPDVEDVYQPGTFLIGVKPGQHTTLLLTAEPQLAPDWGTEHHEDAVAQSLLHHQLRIKQLLAVADRSVNALQRQAPIQARFVVAADQFIVARPDYTPHPQDGALASTGKIQLSPNRKTVIAGYPWFTDWGRDTMISLPGLLLSTGRYSEARGLLKAFAGLTHNGLIPNRFPDGSAPPEYNTADATLWMFCALDSYIAATHDWSILKDLFPTFEQIIDWHVRGTDYGIGVDVTDGLLRAGAAGVQVTWMDAKIGDWVVTPRWGKPVEINALWYRALALMESWAVHLSTDASVYSNLRTQVLRHFAERFWYSEGGYLYDVVDVEGIAGKVDTALRPNQLFAASLAHELLSEAQTANMLEKVTRHLLTPMGLRTLSPTDPAYHSRFNGDARTRDEAYHQGTVWPWLIGAYIDVHLRVHNDRKALVPLLQSLVAQLWKGCLGTLSEVAEPEPPFMEAGCFAQAWSVAEFLRSWLLLKE